MDRLQLADKDMISRYLSNTQAFDNLTDLPLTCKLSAGCMWKCSVSARIRTWFVRMRARAARRAPASRRAPHTRTHTLRAPPSPALSHTR